MNRIDELLGEALSSGRIPDDATPAERAELAELLAPAARLRHGAERVEAESAAAMPIARARFERFLADATRPTPALPVAPWRHSLFGRFTGHGRIIATAGAAVAVALVAVVALAGSQVLTSTTESASALTLDDYVQVQGVVAGTSGDSVTIRSDANDLTVELSNATTTDANGEATSQPLKPGDTVLVAGVATGVRSIAATTVALADVGQSIPKKANLKELKQFRPGVQGRIALLAIGKNGNAATVLLITPSGERLVIRVDGTTAEALLNRSASALGAAVTVTDGDVPNDGIFALTLSASGTTPTPGAAPAASPTFAGVRGVVVAREGNLIQVLDAARKVVTVVVRPATRILLGDSGLTAADLTDPRPAIGHEVAVSGSRETRNGRIIADVIVLGPALAQ